MKLTKWQKNTLEFLMGIAMLLLAIPLAKAMVGGF